MALWSFWDYITEDNQDLIADWYALQDDDVQAQFDATLLILSATEDWESEHLEVFKSLKREHAGLGEIRFHVMALAPGAARPHRRRFRPVGIWPAVNREFILILGCEKSGRTFIPHDAFGLAIRHKALLEEGRGMIRERV
jgi:hypothetical protein